MSKPQGIEHLPAISFAFPVPTRNGEGQARRAGCYRSGEASGFAAPKKKIPIQSSFNGSLQYLSPLFIPPNCLLPNCFIELSEWAQ